jgi:hypothetical protein
VTSTPRRTHDRKALQILTKQLSGDTAKRLRLTSTPSSKTNNDSWTPRPAKTPKANYIAIAYDRILGVFRLTCPEGFLSDLDAEEAMDMCDRITASLR